MTDQLPATTKPKNPVAVLLTSVQAREHEFARALPSHVPAAKFVRALQTAITSSKDIGQCTERSVIMECMKAAADGLVIDNREATLVKMNVNVGTKQAPKWESQAKYIPMYQGLMKMARNSGEVSTIGAHIVYEKDLFKHTKGDDEKIIHEPYDGDDDAGEPTRAYCIVKLKDGSIIRESMKRAQILKIASKTKNAYQYDPDKGDSWEEWWRKTVIRRISKYMPKSTDREAGDFFEAVRRDDDLYDPETGEVHVTPPPVPRKTRGAGKKAMEQAQPQSGVAIPAGDSDPELPDFLRRTGETPVTDEDEADDSLGERNDQVGDII